MLLILTTIRRLALVFLLFLAWVPAAYAWSWPVQGPVLQPFVYDKAHPYASGQHRGIDIGADSAGETVVAPAAGTVSFAGWVPTNGKSVTIDTADGYSVTLTHLESILVGKGATVAEQDAIGTVGPSGTPEVDGPYVHLGIRVTADPKGYVDPLGLLPPLPQSGADQSGSGESQPSSGASSAPPATNPGSSAPGSPQVKKTRVKNTRVKTTRVKTPRVETTEVTTTQVRATRGSAAQPGRSDDSADSAREHGRERSPRAESRPRRSSHRPSVREVRAPLEAATPQPRSRRPSVEPAVAGEPIGLHAGREVQHEKPALLAPALCNGLPALVALVAVLLTAQSRRRRRAGAGPTASAQVVHLQRRVAEDRRVSRAA